MFNMVFFPFIISLLVTMLLIPPLMKTASRTGFMDLPNKRKVHVQAIPRVGGLALVSASLLSIVFWVPIDKPLISLILGIAILLVFGAWDDRNGLNYRIKFFSQFLAAAIVVFYGDIRIIHLPFIGDGAIPGPVLAILTIVVIVGITNAINLADGLDGLSGGKTLLIFICMGLLAFQVGLYPLSLLNMIFVGAILGFLRFNTYPAQVFMGDAGSQVLGFSSVVLALVLTQTADAMFSVLMPVLLFALPVFDTVSVMSQRIAHGRSPFSPDQNHLHHRLLFLGLSHIQAVVFVYVMQSVLVTSAYFFRFENDGVILALFITVCSLLAALVYVSTRGRWKITHGSRPAEQQYLGESSRRLIQRCVSPCMSLLFPLLLLAGPAAGGEIPLDLRYASVLILLLTGAFALLVPRWYRHWLRIAAYIACAVSIFLLESGNGSNPFWPVLIDAGFVLLAICVALGIGLSKEHLFQVTPLDFLVIFLCLVVPGIGFVNNLEIPVAVFVARMVVLMYACEYLFSAESRIPAGVTLGVTGSLGLVVGRWLL